ncbi:hypothetical protein SGPA1_50954 [Streptomyces misionensis JCM 4497]
MVGRLHRDRLHPVALGVPPRLAGRRHRLRHRGRLSALVPLPGADDLLLLRDRLRAVPVSGGGDADRRDHRPTGLRRHPPRGRRHLGRRPGPADRLELHLLLAPVHRHGDPDRPVAGADVAGHVGVAVGWSRRPYDHGHARTP